VQQQTAMLTKMTEQLQTLAENLQIVRDSQKVANERIDQVNAASAETRDKLAILEAKKEIGDDTPASPPVKLNFATPGPARKPHLVREQALNSQLLTLTQKREELGLADYDSFTSSQLDVFRGRVQSSPYFIFDANATAEWKTRALEEYKNIAVALTLAPSALLTYLNANLPSSMEINHWIAVAKSEYGIESNGYAIIKLISDFLLSEKTYRSDSGGQLFFQELQSSIRSYVDNLMNNIPPHVASNFDSRSDYFTRIVTGMQFGDHDNRKKDEALTILETNFLSVINQNKKAPVRYHFELLLKSIAEKLQLDEAKLNTPALVLAISNPNCAALVTQAIQSLPSGMFGHKTHTSRGPSSSLPPSTSSTPLTPSTHKRESNRSTTSSTAPLDCWKGADRTKEGVPRCLVCGRFSGKLEYHYANECPKAVEIEKLLK